MYADSLFNLCPFHFLKALLNSPIGKAIIIIMLLWSTKTIEFLSYGHMFLEISIICSWDIILYMEYVQFISKGYYQTKYG
jgi:hypothetical protein